jgi:iron complex outermembrane recepter protein
VTLTNVGGRSTFQNAGTTRRRGVEAAWSATYAENLRAQLALTYLDAIYRDSFLTCNLSPCPVASQQRVAAGNRIPGVARGTAYASLAWVPALGWRGGVEARRTGMVPVNDTNSDATPRAIVVGANVGYVARIGAWQLTGFVRGDNLFDKRYAGSVIVNEGNGRFFEPAPGRTWLVGTSASYAF